MQKKTNATYINVGFGSALLLKRELTILETGTIPLMRDSAGVNPRILQFAAYLRGGLIYLVAHLHGIWIPENTKGDDPRREKQSLEVVKCLEMLAHKHKTDRIVFGGDLNLDIATKAIALLETGIPGVGPFRNLIREHGISNTRTRLYRKFDDPNGSKFADYILVSEAVKVHEFIVDTSSMASDHAPLQITLS